MSRLPIRLAALIVSFFTFLLFLSGYHIQQQSLNAMQAALGPRPTYNPPKTTPFHLTDQSTSTSTSSSSSAYTKPLTGKKHKNAYIQYVTTKDTLCNAIMILAELHRLGSDAERILYYPHAWVGSERGTWNRLLRAAEQQYGIIVRSADEEARELSLLRAFGETEYRRVMHLGATGMVLRNMDALFHAPVAVVAGVRRYGGEGKGVMGGQLLLLTPSQNEYRRVMAAMEMDPEVEAVEVLNRLYAEHALLLPQHPYDTPVEEFMKGEGEHGGYVLEGEWDAERVREESWYVSFEGKVPRPWVEGGAEEGPGGREEGRVWKGLYERWAGVRRDVCGLDLVPALRT